MREANSEEPSDLGRFVRERREAAGLSQRQLALAASVSVSNISRLESGFHPTPSLELLRRVAEVLGIDMAELLSYRGIPMPEGSAGLKIYLRRQYGLPEEGVAEVQEAVERISAKYRKTKDSPERRTG
jgi:transcriptional regulator with XRE-family HTH domain